MPSLSRLYNLRSGKSAPQLLALLLTLVVTAPTLFAQEWDHFNGRDKVHDPTGVWLLNTNVIPPPTTTPVFFLITFNQGGTVTEDIQGESAFDPAAVNPPPTPPANVQTSPQHGVWQRTGWNTFAATLFTIEWQIITGPEPASPVFQFTKLQYTGKLQESGDKMELGGTFTHYSQEGKQKGDSIPFKANGVRIPLEILPHTSDSVTIPPIPPAH
jgi:hypothetical protein